MNRVGGFYPLLFTYVQEFFQYLKDKKNRVAIVVLTILVIALPIALFLVGQVQNFLPRAAGETIELAEGPCIVVKNGKKVAICGNIPLKLTSSFGGPANPNASPFPSTSPTSSPTASSSPTSSASPTSSSSPSASSSPSSSASPSPSSSSGNGYFNPDSGGSLTTGLAAFWKMEDGSGNATDLLGKNNLFASGRSISYNQTGAKNKAIGITNNMQTNETFFLCKNGSCTDFINLTPKAGSGFSYQAWIKPASYAFTGEGAQSRIIAFVKGFSASGYSLSIDNKGAVRAEMGNSNCTNDSAFGYQNNVTVPLNQWSHLVVTVSNENPGVLKIYKNGQLAYTSPKQAYHCGGDGNFFLGTEGDNSIPDMKYSGLLDEVGIWSKELTSQEVTDLYNNRTGSASSGSVLGNFFNRLKNFGIVYAKAGPNQELALKGQIGGFPAIIIPSSASSNKQTIINCLNDSLNVEAAPVTSQDKNNSTLVYWDENISSKRFLQERAPTCGAQVLNPTNFTHQALEALVISVTGNPTSNTDASKYRHVLVEGACNSTEIERYRSAGIKIGGDIDCNQTELGYKINQHVPSDNHFDFGIGDADEGTQCSDGKDNDKDSKIDAADPECHSDGNANNPDSYDPFDNLEANDGKGTVSYKLAETEAGLGGATAIPYTSHPTITTFTLSNTTPGTKQIWVEYLSSTGETLKDHINIEFVQEDPTITNLDCTVDIARTNLKLNLKGKNFGAEKGKVTANKQDAEILDWKDLEVSALLRTSGAVTEGQEFKVVLTRKDGAATNEVSCRVNTSILSLGAKIFCRKEGMFDQNDVKVVLVDETKSKVEETVTISKDGIVQGITTKLQAGKRYALSIKAPYSLRRNAIFTASTGTTIAEAEGGGAFILPIGDIAPAISRDGVINTLDRSELTRQWRVLTAATNLSGDFNRDTRVNSVDWACMRYDFGEEDDPIPNEVPGITTQTGNNGGGNNGGNQPSELASFKLLTDALPNLKVGQELPVKVFVRNDKDEANLFAAKLKFNKDVLEVVRIEKSGSFISSWAEEFIDNNSGLVSLVGGVPTPGYKTNNSDALMAIVVFKGKAAGNSVVSFAADSEIFRNSDNNNILRSNLEGITLFVTN